MVKRFILFGALILVTTPLFAQDEGGGFGSIFGGDLGIERSGGRGSAGPPDRLLTLRELLSKANAPLTNDQERTLKPMIESEIQRMQDSIRQKFPEFAAQQGETAEGQRRGRGDGGGQGRGGSRGGAVDPNSPVGVEMHRMNEDLLAKVTAALKPEQQSALKRYRDDQIKQGGGLEALKLTMQEAGQPLTADQEAKAKALYDQQGVQRRQLTQESQGRPEPAKLQQLDREMMPKLLQLLSAEQKKALAESMKARQQ